MRNSTAVQSSWAFTKATSASNARHLTSPEHRTYPSSNKLRTGSQLPQKDVQGQCDFARNYIILLVSDSAGPGEKVSFIGPTLPVAGELEPTMLALLSSTPRMLRKWRSPNNLDGSFSWESFGALSIPRNRDIWRSTDFPSSLTCKQWKHFWEAWNEVNVSNWKQQSVKR